MSLVRELGTSEMEKYFIGDYVICGKINSDATYMPDLWCAYLAEKKIVLNCIMKQVDWMSEIKTTKHSVVTTVNNMNS
jgi:hypothetical protein